MSHDTSATSRQFSVVIPTRYRNDLLALCLDRLAPGKQTMDASEYEVIVTDDGERSTAQEMIGQRYRWARWTQGPRRGPAANRNHGAREARGQWIVFTDDDCLPAPGWLAAYAEAVRPATAVYEGKTTCEEGITSPLLQAPVNESGGLLWSCNMFIDRTLFQQLGGFDEAFPYPHLEDVDLRERLKDAGYAISFVPRALVDHPARRVPGPCRLARMQESEIAYYKKRGQPLSFRSHMRRFIMARARQILRNWRSRDTAAAILSFVVEFGLVCYLYPGWARKYRSDTNSRSVPQRSRSIV